VSPFFKVLNDTRIPALGRAEFDALKLKIDEMILGRSDVPTSLADGSRRRTRPPGADP
jgi:hypothetical protein